MRETKVMLVRCSVQLAVLPFMVMFVIVYGAGSTFLGLDS